MSAPTAEAPSMSPEIQREPQVIMAGVTNDAPKLADLKAEAERRRNESKQEAIDRLEDELREERVALAEIGAKRGGRFHTMAGSSTRQLYEARHSGYNAKVIELGKLQFAEALEKHDEQSHVEKAQTNADIIKYLFDEQKRLRDLTTERLEGTRLGKVVKWMNKGSKFSKFVKFAGIGVMAGAFGAVTGGIGAGVVAGGVVGLAAKFGRGFIRAEGQHGRHIEEFDPAQLHGLTASGLTLLEQGAEHTKGSYEQGIKGRQKRVRKAVGRGALYAGMGAGIGYAAGHAIDAGSNWIDSRSGTGTSNAEVAPMAYSNDVTPGSPAHAVLAEQQSWASLVEQYAYHPDQNPFYLPKEGIHDMGPALHGDVALDAGRPAGFNDLTQNRWLNSPEQFASVVAAMGLDNLPDDMQTINGLAEQFKANPISLMSKHEQVMNILNDPNTNIYQKDIINPYSSEYGVDMGNGNMDLAWDDNVDQGGTKTVIEYTDQNGVRRVLELRNECGGQRIVEHPDVVVPDYVPAEWSEQYAPVYAAPQGAGTYYEQTSYETSYAPEPTYAQEPQGGGTPPQQQNAWNPPVVAPPATGGGSPPPVQELAQKIPSQDANINIIEQMQQTLGNITAGALQSEGSVTVPNQNYDNPIPRMGSTPSTEFATGANRSQEAIQTHSNGPAAQPGLGTNSGNVSE